MNLEEYLDGPVTLFGIAENAMGGAAVMCGPRSLVYIDGLHAWNDTDLAAAIEVSGTLVARGDDADLRGPDGTVLHGIGRHYVVREATWERVS